MLSHPTSQLFFLETARKPPTTHESHAQVTKMKTYGPMELSRAKSEQEREKAEAEARKKAQDTAARQAQLQRQVCVGFPFCNRTSLTRLCLAGRRSTSPGWSSIGTSNRCWFPSTAAAIPSTSAWKSSTTSIADQYLRTTTWIISHARSTATATASTWWFTTGRPTYTNTTTLPNSSQPSSSIRNPCQSEPISFPRSCSCHSSNKSFWKSCQCTYAGSAAAAAS